MLGCKVEDFPITYLGMSLHWKKPTKEMWSMLIQKIQLKLDGWKGKFLSMGGRIIMINSVLSRCAPLFSFSIYKVPKWVINAIDKIRRQFLWSGVDNPNRKSFISWSSVIIHKDFGGMGILDLEQMNIALLSKWVWRFFSEDDTIWKKLIMFKYSFPFKGLQSPFWMGVLTAARL